LEVPGRLEAFNLYQPGQHVELAMRRTICNVILASGNPSPGHSCISTASATVPDPATELAREEEAKPELPGREGPNPIHSSSAQPGVTSRSST